MASGVKCEPDIPDVWNAFKTDSTLKQNRTDFTPVSIGVEDVAATVALFQDGTKEEKSEVKCKLAYCNYMLFHVEAEKMIKIHSAGEIKKTGDETDAAVLNEVLAAQTSEVKGKIKAHCRYVAYKLDFTGDGRGQSKITGFLWNPEGAPMKEKMIYASSKDEIKKKLTGMESFKQASEVSDLADLFQDIIGKR